MMKSFTDVHRAIGNVTFDGGAGVGGALVALRAMRHASWGAEVRQNLIDKALQNRIGETGVVRLRLLETNREATNAKTKERALRTVVDGTIDWALLVETDTIERAERIGAEMQTAVQDIAGADCQFDCVLYRLAYWAPSAPLRPL
jgi:hypothetical protein